jgi:hypothetical protein
VPAVATGSTARRLLREGAILGVLWIGQEHGPGTLAGRVTDPGRRSP